MTTAPPTDPKARLSTRWPRWSMFVFCLSLLATAVLTADKVYEVFRKFSPSAGVPAATASASPGSRSFRAGAMLYSTYFWVERGSARAGGAAGGIPFKTGFGRADHILSKELPPLLQELGVQNPAEWLNPAQRAVADGDKERAHDALNRLSEKLIAFLEGREFDNK